MNNAVTLRRATLDDVSTFERWDRDPDVIACSTDAPDADIAFGEHDWGDELRAVQPGIREYFIAELEGRPIGAMQIIDPHLEPTHYWGEVEPGLRAIDIWIGDPADRSKGLGETMMRLALQRCFANAAVSGILIDPLISNTRAHQFYQRLGFVPVGPRRFNDEDDCLVHRLDRATWRVRFPEDSAHSHC